MSSGATEQWIGERRRAPWLALRTRLRLFVRTRIRNDDFGLVCIAALLGGIVGLGVVITRDLLSLLQYLLFGVRFEAHHVDAVAIEWWRVLFVPMLGGLGYGLAAHFVRRRYPHDVVDPIEANAIYGGRMSLSDSLRLTVLSVLSAGVGASVGLEAAYTQLGSGIASRLGRSLRLRRGDLRTFVGCGAAAAIAAAFNAPLAGAFYAYELIIGSYTLATLAPVAIAALCSVLVTRRLWGDEPIFVVAEHVSLHGSDYVLLAVLGVAAAALGIVTMIGVTVVESWFRRFEMPLWVRPAAGGLLLGNIAFLYPEVLGSGHGGIVTGIASGFALPLLLGLLVAKLTGSAVSIGSGFRGGMFSSSLFLGVLFGGAFASVISLALPSLAPDRVVFALAGMGAVATSIVGAPVTMILLVLEATADFPATIGVTAAVVLASFAVRYWFGYSFATWRFHVRGVGLRGAHDIGWLQDLTVGRIMRRGAPTASRDLPVETFRSRFPAGAAKYVFLVDAGGRYGGMVDLQEAHGGGLDQTKEPSIAADLASHQAHFLLPGQPLRVALDLFVAADTEALAVVDNTTDRHILGYLTEAYALRRYNQELEARRREELGDSDLFGPAPPAAGKTE